MKTDRERDPGCTCGSGGHPRACALHPESYRLHVAELNVLALVDEAEKQQAREAIDEFDAAFRAARDVRNVTIDHLRAELLEVSEKAGLFEAQREAARQFSKTIEHNELKHAEERRELVSQFTTARERVAELEGTTRGCSICGLRKDEHPILSEATDGPGWHQYKSGGRR